jgi:hypothetical protein
MKAARSALLESTPRAKRIENSTVDTDQRNIESGESIKNSKISTIPAAMGPTNERIPSGTKFLSALAVNL